MVSRGLPNRQDGPYLKAGSSVSRSTAGFGNFAVAAVIMFAIGAVLHADVYGSLLPAAGTLVLAILVWLGVVLFAGRRSHAPATFCILIAVYWLAGGVLIWLEGPTQIVFGSLNDYEKFYTLLATYGVADSLEDIQRQTEGALAVLVWRYLYEAAQALGFPLGAYIGVALNVCAMALTGALTLQLVESVCGRDRSRTIWLIVLFASSGHFLLSAAYHMRDAYPTLAITVLAYIWVLYLIDRSFFKLLSLIAVSGSSVFVLYYLREEFAFVPLTFAAAGIGAMIVARDIRGAERAGMNLLALVGLLGIAVAVQLYGGEALERLDRGNKAYAEFAADGAASGSLGIALFINQPLPIRVMLGPAYVMLMPIPVWSGLLSGVGYYLFKSVGALWFYFMGPAFAAAILLALASKRARLAAIVFLLAGFGGFLVLIGATSAEARHLSAFMPLLVATVAILMPQQEFRKKLRPLAYAGIVLMVSVHLAWFVLKGF